MKDLLSEAAAVYDKVILDTPPVLVADTKILGSYTDGIMVISSGKTDKEKAAKAKEALDYCPCKLLVVMNGKKQTKHSDYAYYGQ